MSNAKLQTGLTPQALAAGNFSAVVHRFAQGGVRVRLPGAGMLQLRTSTPAAMQLLISVGVHGNETAPIEMLAPVLDSLACTPANLAVDLLVVVGNPAALAIGSRFIDADLNRLFCTGRGGLKDAAEAVRADDIMRASADFFDGSGAARWHLDLHSAIRPSRYARFAIVPAPADDPAQSPLLRWLGSAAIDAVLFNSQRAPTYSAYTAAELGALSCTAELGQIGVLGQNLLQQLARTQAALAALLAGQAMAAVGDMLARFRVAQEIIKRSDDFRMNIEDTTHNFTAMAPGAVIATDGGIAMRVGTVTEYIVFPNPGVLVGQRAGLMVVHEPAASAGSDCVRQET